MSDGVSGIGSAPFNVGSDIHQQTRARERIENAPGRAESGEST